MNESIVRNAFVNSTSKSQVCRILDIHTNGVGFKKIDELVIKYNIDTSHFKKGDFNRRYKRITKICPVCGDEFETSLNSPREKTTCSHSCSNTFFRSGEEHPNWKVESYRSTCFLHHKKECIICGEKNIVEVHHYDSDNTNNSKENLIPMCPTHHQYYHSGFRYLVEEKINEYQINFKNENVL